MDKVKVKNILLKELANLGQKIDQDIRRNFDSNPLLELKESFDIPDEEIQKDSELVITLGSYDIIVDWGIYEDDSEIEDIKFNFIYNQIEGTAPDNHTNLDLHQLLKIVEKLYTHL